MRSGLFLRSARCGRLSVCGSTLSPHKGFFIDELPNFAGFRGRIFSALGWAVLRISRMGRSPKFNALRLS